MLNGFLHRMSSTFYVRIDRNCFHVRHVESFNVHVESSATPFSTQRLLVGNFASAEACLTKAINAVSKQLKKRQFLAPRVLMHPREMVEGGLSEVEERVLRELGLSAGARRVEIWIGEDLHDDEIRGKFD